MYRLRCVVDLLLVGLPSDWFYLGLLSTIESTRDGASSSHLLGHAQPYVYIRLGSLAVARRYALFFSWWHIDSRSPIRSGIYGLRQPSGGSTLSLSSPSHGGVSRLCLTVAFDVPCLTLHSRLQCL